MTGTEAKWAERVREWRESGKRAEEFAAGQPFAASTLRWWGTEIRQRVEGGGGRRRERGRGGEESIPMARVVRRPRVPEPGRGSVVVEVSGARITVARGFDAELFSEVVRALAGAK